MPVYWIAPLVTIDEFTRGYLEAALWTSDPYSGISGEWSEHDEWTIANIRAEDLQRAIVVCADFQRDNREDLEEVSDTYHVDSTQHGHDFWLTRNGHGCGFWDRGYDLNDLGRKLTEAAHAFGVAYVTGPETTDQGNSTPEQLAAWDRIIYLQD